MTFSIVGRDSDGEKLGIAIASVFPAVGAVCPYVGNGVAVSSQSWDSGRTYGDPITSMAGDNISLETACEAVLENRAGAEGTQLHGVAADGSQFTYTGERCVGWAGHVEGEHHTAAGNMLVGERVVTASSETFAESEGPLAERLLEALEAGEAVGGDKRGDNLSAALLVRGPESKLYHNLRVDDPGNPIEGVRRGYDVAVEAETAERESPPQGWEEDYPESIHAFEIKY